MKKLLVFMLVLGMTSFASAGLIDGIVEWDVVGWQLIGTGLDYGIYNTNLDIGLLAPATGTDSGKAGTMNAAGNLGAVTNYGIVWNAFADHLAIGEGAQVPGETWFVFDILGVGDVTFYDSSFIPIGASIHVPEPISLALLGLGGLFLRRRK